MPTPPTMAMTIMVMNHATGKSPVKRPVKAKGFSRHDSPMASNRLTIPLGPPAAAMPQKEVITITASAITPCWKSAMTTPQ